MYDAFIDHNDLYTANRVYCRAVLHRYCFLIKLEGLPACRHEELYTY